MGLYTEGVFIRGLLIYGTTFVSGVFHTCSLYFKKDEWNKTKEIMLPLMKIRDVYHNSGPLASLKLKNTWGGALISVDLLQITLLHILFLYFYIGLIFGEALYLGGLYKESLFCQFFDGLIYEGGLYSAFHRDVRFPYSKLHKRLGKRNKYHSISVLISDFRLCTYLLKS